MHTGIFSGLLLGAFLRGAMERVKVCLGNPLSIFAPSKKGAYTLMSDNDNEVRVPVQDFAFDALSDLVIGSALTGIDFGNIRLDPILTCFISPQQATELYKLYAQYEYADWDKVPLDGVGHAYEGIDYHNNFEGYAEAISQVGTPNDFALGLAIAYAAYRGATLIDAVRMSRDADSAEDIDKVNYCCSLAIERLFNRALNLHPELLNKTSFVSHDEEKTAQLLAAGFYLMQLDGALGEDEIAYADTDGIAGKLYEMLFYEAWELETEYLLDILERHIRKTTLPTISLDELLEENSREEE